MTEQRARRLAVIGGGPSGLAAAYRLSELDADLSITLFEASDRFGGLIETVERDGFLIERGADSFISTKPAGVELCRRLGLADELISPNDENRRSLIVRDGKPVTTPDNFHLVVPRRIEAVLESPLLSTAGKLRFLQEPAIPPCEEPDQSLAAFARRRFGTEALERLIQPITAGIYSADPEELSMAATMPQFLAMERKYGSLTAAGIQQRHGESESASGARYGLFVSFKEGMQRLFQTLARALEARCDLRLTTPVESVRRDTLQWEVVTNSGAEAFDAVIIALPAYRAVQLIDGLDAGPLDEIPTASSAIVVTGHHRDQVGHPLDAFGMVVPFAEQRPITAVSFASQKFPARTPPHHVLVRTFIGGPHGGHLLDGTDESLVGIVQQQLADLLQITGDPVVTEVARYPHASPQYILGHLDRVAAIEAAVSKIDGLELAGASYRGVGFPDAVASGDAAAERVCGTA